MKTKMFSCVESLQTSGDNVTLRGQDLSEISAPVPSNYDRTSAIIKLIEAKRAQILELPDTTVRLFQESILTETIKHLKHCTIDRTLRYLNAEKAARERAAETFWQIQCQSDCPNPEERHAAYARMHIHDEISLIDGLIRTIQETK